MFLLCQGDVKTRVAGSLGQGLAEEVRELGGAANVSMVFKSKGLSSFPDWSFPLRL